MLVCGHVVNPFTTFTTCHLLIHPTLTDEKQSKSNLLVAREGHSLLEQPEWIQNLPAIPGQPAVHQTWHPAL